jgi:hypothetical protein
MIVNVTIGNVFARGGPRLLIWYAANDERSQMQMFWTSWCADGWLGEWRFWWQAVTEPGPEPSTVPALSLPSEP